MPFLVFSPPKKKHFDRSQGKQRPKFNVKHFKFLINYENDQMGKILELGGILNLESSFLRWFGQCL